MARKTSVPSEQLERLKDRYNQEREALLALATAESSVEAAQDTLAAAEQALQNSQAEADASYQALVDLIGANAAAELTGRRTNGKRTGASRKPAANAPATSQQETGFPGLGAVPGEEQ